MKTKTIFCPVLFGVTLAILCGSILYSSAWADVNSNTVKENVQNKGTQQNVPEFEMKPGMTLESVRDEIRAWRKTSPENGAKKVTVRVHAGTYFFDAPVTLEPEDSNIAFIGQDLSSSNHELPLFTRGKEITGWKINEQGWFETVIPQVAQGKWWFEQLYVNNQRATRAKTPNDFYHYIQDQVDSAWDPVQQKEIASGSRAFIPRKEEVPLFERLAKMASERSPLDDVQIRFFHSWASSKHRIRSYTPEKKTVLLTGDARWNLTYWGVGKLRYEMEGAREFLDAPGEFHLDRKGTLTYIPRPGETLEHCRFFAPDGPKTFEESGFIRIQGNLDAIRKSGSQAADEQWYVSNLTFAGIAFRYDPFTLPAEGLSTGQAATNTPISIMVEGAKNIGFDRCEVSHIGGYAFWFHRACADCTIEHCFLEDMGAGGVRIGTHFGEAEYAGNLLTRRVTVADNVIRTYGQIEASAIGVWIGHGAENTITHNDISNGFYTGISCGWVWGYRPSPSINNTISFNRIHHIGQGVLSDMGGFYSLGISPGTSVCNNVIHDVFSYNHYGRGGWGLYTDEGSSQMLFENNLVYRVHTGTIHQHYGQGNIFRNNILAFSQDGQIQRSRIEPHCSFMIENNIIIWDTSELFSRSWKENKDQFVLKKNLYWFYGEPTTEEEKEKKFFVGQTLSQWQDSGNDQGSVLADPGFIDPKNGHFRFSGKIPNAAIQSIGFVPFDDSKAGLTTDTAALWGKKFSNFSYPAVRQAPEPPPVPPLTIQEDFEGLRTKPIPKATANTGTPSQGWKLTVSELAANGKPGNVLLQKEDMRFSNPLWNDFRWFGFCALGSEEATIDLNHLVIREVFSDAKNDKKPFVIEQSFDKLEKLPFPQANLHFENVPDGMSLQEENGKQFLRLKDGPVYKASYNPHLFYQFSSLTDQAVVSFDARVSAKTTLHTEARDLVGSRYNIGPSLIFSGGKLSAQGEELGDIPIDRWIHVEMKFPVGSARVKPPYEILKEGDNHFLRINDAPYFKPAFEPHFHYSPGHLSGETAIGFKVRTTKDGRLVFEGRDANNPYRTAFSVHFHEGKITAANKPVCNYLYDQWYQIDMKLTFGANKKWALTISEIAADGKKGTVLATMKDLPIQHNAWEELQWLGVVSAGEKQSQIDLDDLVIEHFDK